MTKKIIALSAVACLATASFGATDVDTRLSNMEKKIKKLEKKLKKSNKKLNQVKAHDAGDNIKWDVDFRTAVDKINYKKSTGAQTANDAFMTNRLLLGMKFQPEDNVVFYGTLGYNKAYGDSASHNQANVSTSNMEYQNFDWVVNENPTDNSVKVKEAYWLYMNDTFMGMDMAWTASVGRRPSTGGLGINYREGDSRKSALAHTVNVEFDGASLKWNLDKVTPLTTGSWFKLCMGRGLTNANARFTMPDGDDHAQDETKDSPVDMVGFIFVPYDNGQYSVHTNYAKALNVIGFDNATTYQMMGFSDAEMQAMFGGITNPQLVGMGYSNTQANTDLHNVGDLTLMTAMFKADGLGDGISDYLDDTTIFASYARSKTHPNGTNGGMLGSMDSQTGSSIWIGAQMPCLLSDDGRIGVEWNKGSKYWRSVTYGEDTMVGSKIATRGTALEFYWKKPLTKSLTLDARYTSIKYDYTGSNAFFGADGTPMSWSEVSGRQAGGMNADPVKESTDLRVAVRYRF